MRNHGTCTLRVEAVNAGRKTCVWASRMDLGMLYRQSARVQDTVHFKSDKLEQTGSTFHTPA